MRLEDIRGGATLAGIVAGEGVRVLATEAAGKDARTVYFKTAGGRLRERMLFRADEPRLHPAHADAGVDFAAPGEDFKLAAEALRLAFAAQDGPLRGLQEAGVVPLPHQLTAVYGAMLPRRPLRFVLADDPGAGKTVMAGLLLRELQLRGRVRRALVVVPGGLVEQWQEEMAQKFGLAFALLAPGATGRVDGHGLADSPLWLARLDQLARSASLQQQLAQVRWDLLVVDEAHKLSASRYGGTVRKTRRYLLGERLGRLAPNLLLLTATPHNGRNADFALFTALLDPPGAPVGLRGRMRRLSKEALVDASGAPLFVPRHAYTVGYALSAEEAALYRAVSRYVRTEFARVDALPDRKRRRTVGFALVCLQRRLASSPQAILHSLRRRRLRLRARVEGERTRCYNAPGKGAATLCERASAAQSIRELDQELIVLGRLELQAGQLVAAGSDRKWAELASLLQRLEGAAPGDAGLSGGKLIVFTEHRDTLVALVGRIAALLGDDAAVTALHGGMSRAERRRAQHAFAQDPAVRVLVATDAAGEGINLQCAHLMVNYDLPWNPNRLQQRFGRIHRIGQTKACHVWNLVAHETREGAVYGHLLEKLEAAQQALGGCSFDVLGELFVECSLPRLLLRAVRADPEAGEHDRLLRQVELALKPERVRQVLGRRPHDAGTGTTDLEGEAGLLARVQQQVARAEARRLPTGAVQAFVVEALARLGGTCAPREPGRYHIASVPPALRRRARGRGGPRAGELPIGASYPCVAFARSRVELGDGTPPATLLHPRHPLVRGTMRAVRARFGAALRRGTVLVDPNDDGTAPRLLVLLAHAVREGGGKGRAASRRALWVWVEPATMRASPAGPAPHLDLAALGVSAQPWAAELVAGLPNAAAGERAAVALAADELAQVHLQEASAERAADPVDGATNSLDPCAPTLASATPAVVGACWVLPEGLLAQHRGEGGWRGDAEDRRRIERVAMAAVAAHERAQGRRVQDVSAARCGWDLTSTEPVAAGQPARVRYIEVKGRARGQRCVTVTRNEVLCAVEHPECYVLAVVLVDGASYEGPYFVPRPFAQAPDWAVASVNLDLGLLLRRGKTAYGAN